MLKVPEGNISFKYTVISFLDQSVNQLEKLIMWQINHKSVVYVLNETFKSVNTKSIVFSSLHQNEQFIEHLHLLIEGGVSEQAGGYHEV